MAFRTRKVYGQSKENHCAFCGGIATQTTQEGLLVCRHHLTHKLEEIKCTCGKWLEQKSGKFGPYFYCTSCGNINFNKAMEMKAVMAGNASSVQSPKPVLSSPKESFEEREKRIRREERRGTETTITSDDVEYFS